MTLYLSCTFLGTPVNGSCDLHFHSGSLENICIFFTDPLVDLVMYVTLAIKWDIKTQCWTLFLYLYFCRHSPNQGRRHSLRLPASKTLCQAGTDFSPGHQGTGILCHSELVCTRVFLVSINQLAKSLTY